MITQTSQLFTYQLLILYIFTSQLFYSQIITSQLFTYTVTPTDEAGRSGAPSLTSTMTAVSRHQAALSNLNKQSQCSSASTKSKQNL